MSDFGTKALETIHRGLQIDEPWTVRRDRGFAWIPHRLQADVAVTPILSGDDYPYCRLCLSVLVVEEIGVSKADVDLALARHNLFADGSAYVHSPMDRTVSLALEATLVEDSWAGMPQLLAWYHTLAVLKAEADGEALAEELRGQLARRLHPESGERSRRDSILDSLAQEFSAAGAEASRFEDEREMDLVHKILVGSSWFSAGGSAAGLCFEVPFGEADTTLVELSTEASHPVLGRGLALRTTLRLGGTLEEAVGLAGALNRAQFGPHPDPMACGAWTVRELPQGAHLAHMQFIPNLFFTGGLARKFALEAAFRAACLDATWFPTLGPRWAHEIIAKRSGIELAG